jgi:hypothetical protein
MISELNIDRVTLPLEDGREIIVGLSPSVLSSPDVILKQMKIARMHIDRTLDFLGRGSKPSPSPASK